MSHTPQIQTGASAGVTIHKDATQSLSQILSLDERMTFFLWSFLPLTGICMDTQTLAQTGTLHIAHKKIQFPPKLASWIADWAEKDFQIDMLIELSVEQIQTLRTCAVLVFSQMYPHLQSIQFLQKMK